MNLTKPARAMGLRRLSQCWTDLGGICEERGRVIMRSRRTVALLFALPLLSLSCGPDRGKPENAVVGRKLRLRGFQPVKDFDVFRADLSDTGGYSSGYRIRNILFVEASGQARWLLADNDHEIVEYRVSGSSVSRGDEPRTVALVLLASPVAADNKPGDLYLCDPPARKGQRIAADVMEVEGAGPTANPCAVLYERRTGYVLGHYDPATLARVREVNFTVPALKSGGSTTR